MKFEGSDEMNYKIGRTGDLQKRKSCLQTGNYKSLVTKWSIPSSNPNALESQIQGFLKLRRVRGEWFRLDDDEAKSTYEFFYSWYVVRGPYRDPVPYKRDRLLGLLEGCCLTGREWIEDEPFTTYDDDTFEEWVAKDIADFFPVLRTAREGRLWMERMLRNRETQHSDESANREAPPEEESKQKERRDENTESNDTAKIRLCGVGSCNGTATFPCNMCSDHLMKSGMLVVIAIDNPHSAVIPEWKRLGVSRRRWLERELRRTEGAEWLLQGYVASGEQGSITLLIDENVVSDIATKIETYVTSKLFAKVKRVFRKDGIVPISSRKRFSEERERYHVR